jgi:CubicO group peptidase (beta-lactamase class C family)
VWNGKRVISQGWVDGSVAPRANARDDVDYGYLWWLQKFGSAGVKHAAFYMAGNGGSKIAAFPDLHAVVVITSTMYGTAKAHQQSEQILNEEIVPAFSR